MRPICIDATVALKWVLPEPDHDVAFRKLQTWLGESRNLVAPLPFVYEVGSILRAYVYRGDVSLEYGNTAFHTLGASPVRIVHSNQLRDLAWKLATRLNLSTLYDATYLALAEWADAEFWTADRRLYNQVSEAIPSVRLLEPSSGD